MRAVALRRSNGESWSRIASDMGWTSRQAAQQWYSRVRAIFQVELDEAARRLKVRSAVGRAKREGRLVPQPCMVCGDENVHAHHHNGYDLLNPLDVVWLCPEHHHAAHRMSAPKDAA